MQSERRSGTLLDALTAGVLATVAYRFVAPSNIADDGDGGGSGGAWASVNGQIWADLGLGGEGPQFVDGAPTVVGGVEAGACGFYGGIGEVLAFRCAVSTIVCLPKL